MNDLAERISRVRGLEAHLRAPMRGQDHVLPRLAAAFARGALGVSSPDRPRASFLFVGPTGTGKIETFTCVRQYEPERRPGEVSSRKVCKSAFVSRPRAGNDSEAARKSSASESNSASGDSSKVSFGAIRRSSCSNAASALRLVEPMRTNTPSSGPRFFK
jgi:hypothetical protein